MIGKRPRGRKRLGMQRVSERSIVRGIKDKGGKQERMENMEARNLPNARTITNKRIGNLHQIKLLNKFFHNERHYMSW